MEETNEAETSSTSERLGSRFNFRNRINKWWPKYKQQRQIRRTYPLKSYSQFGEDIVLQHLLPDQVGTYIDIGSGHPIVGSNTYLLYQRGWSGVLVDPIETNISESRETRPRDVCIQAACGQESTEVVTFYEYDIYEYSTTSAERVLELTKLGHLVTKTYTVESVNVNDLLAKTTNKSPLVLCIDVEGAEFNVLRQIKWDMFSPEYIVVEEWNPPLTRHTDISNYLFERGYKVRGVAGLSSIYVRDI